MNDLTYRRAIALAHACNLDWARFALGVCRCCGLGCCHGTICMRCKGDARDPLPVPNRIEDLHAPYLADCEQRRVKPGPLPALRWTSDDGRIDWGFFDGHPYVRVAGLTFETWTLAWDVRGCGSPADIELASRLVNAVSEVCP